MSWWVVAPVSSLETRVDFQNPHGRKRKQNPLTPRKHCGMGMYVHRHAYTDTHMRMHACTHTHAHMLACSYTFTVVFFLKKKHRKLKKRDGELGREVDTNAKTQTVRYRQ